MRMGIFWRTWQRLLHSVCFVMHMFVEFVVCVFLLELLRVILGGFLGFGVFVVSHLKIVYSIYY